MPRLFGDAREELVFGILTRALKQKRFSRALTPIPLQAWMDAVGHRWRDQIDAARALILRRLNARLGPGTVRGFQFGPLPATDLRATEAPATLREDCPGALACDVSEAFSRAASAAHRRQRA